MPPRKQLIKNDNNEVIVTETVKKPRAKKVTETVTDNVTTTTTTNETIINGVSNIPGMENFMKGMLDLVQTVTPSKIDSINTLLNDSAQTKKSVSSKKSKKEEPKKEEPKKEEPKKEEPKKEEPKKSKKEEPKKEEPIKDIKPKKEEPLKKDVEIQSTDKKPDSNLKFEQIKTEWATLCEQIKVLNKERDRLELKKNELLSELWKTCETSNPKSDNLFVLTENVKPTMTNKLNITNRKINESDTSSDSSDSSDESESEVVIKPKKPVGKIALKKAVAQSESESDSDSDDN
jgi:hypothetical protein